MKIKATVKVLTKALTFIIIINTKSKKEIPKAISLKHLTT